MNEFSKQKIRTKVSLMFEQRIMDIDTEEIKENLQKQGFKPEGVKKELKNALEHVNYVPEMSQRLIELDKQKGYNEYSDVDHEIVFLAAILHDLGDIEIGNLGYDHMNKPYHMINCVEKAMKFLDDIGYSKLYPEKAKKILDIISVHDDKDVLKYSDKEATAVIETDRLWRYEPDEFLQAVEYVKKKKGRTLEQILKKLNEEIGDLEKPFGFKTEVSRKIAESNLSEIVKRYSHKNSYNC